MEDGALIGEINAAVEADTRLAIDDLAIAFDPDEGSVTLNGWVEDIRMKRMAANEVGRVLGDRAALHDRIRVRVRDEGDPALCNAVVSCLSSEGMFSNHTITLTAGGNHELIHQGRTSRIDVEVDNGVVTLRGEVPSLSHRRFAEVLIWWTAGCQRVDNFLVVDPPEADHDDEITDVLRMVLEKDPLVHASQLRIGTAGGIVEFHGLLTSEEERRLATLDAWYVPGVWDVVDRIEVR